MREGTAWWVQALVVVGILAGLAGWQGLAHRAYVSEQRAEAEQAARERGPIRNEASMMPETHWKVTGAPAGWESYNGCYRPAGEWSGRPVWRNEHGRCLARGGWTAWTWDAQGGLAAYHHFASWGLMPWHPGLGAWWGLPWFWLADGGEALPGTDWVRNGAESRVWYHPPLGATDIEVTACECEAPAADRFLFWSSDDLAQEFWALDSQLIAVYDPGMPEYGGQIGSGELPAGNWWVGRSDEPAPTLSAWPYWMDPADWAVEGAGDDSYNGLYAEAGEYNGKPYYVRVAPLPDYEEPDEWVPEEPPPDWPPEDPWPPDPPPPLEHVVEIVSGPEGAPNPVASEGEVECAVWAICSHGHAVGYEWSAAAGAFDEAAQQFPRWTAPANTSGVTVSKRIEAAASCTVAPEIGDEGEYWQQVLSEGEEPPGPDPEGPVVEILRPGEAEQVAGQFIVRARIRPGSDPIATAQVDIGGLVMGELSEPNAGEDEWQWVLTAQGFVNGGHVLRVRAWDTEGRLGWDAVVIVVAHGMAEMTRYLYTKQLSPETHSMWRRGGEVDLGIVTVDGRAPALPENPLYRYNVDCAVGAAGLEANFEGMQPIRHRRAHGFAGRATTCRWAFRARPQQVLASWLSGVEDLIRLRVWQERIWALTPSSVLRFDGAEFTEWRDLAEYGTATDFVIWENKVVACCGPQLVFCDPDAGEEDFVLEPPVGTAQFDVVDDFAGQLMVGARVDAEMGKLLKLTSGWDLIVIAEGERITALGPGETSLGIGCAGGKVYSASAAGVNLLIDTGQATVGRIVQIEGQALAGTGTEGRVYHSQPAWGEEIRLTPTPTEVRAIAGLNGGEHILAGGNDALVWMRGPTGAWIQWMELHCTAVNDMIEFEDAIWFACSDAADARLYRLEISAAGEFVWGVQPPNFVAKLLRRRANV